MGGAEALETYFDPKWLGPTADDENTALDVYKFYRKRFLAEETDGMWLSTAADGSMCLSTDWLSAQRGARGGQSKVVHTDCLGRETMVIRRIYAAGPQNPVAELPPGPDDAS